MGTVFVVLVVAVVVLMLIGSVALTRRQVRKRQERKAKASQSYPLVFIPGKVSKTQGVRLTVGPGFVEPEAEIHPPPPAYAS